MKHGTLKLYKNGCRCTKCVAKNKEHKELLAKKEEIRKTELWAVYKGDRLLTIGTISEVCRRMRWSKSTFNFYQTAIYKKRCTDYDKQFFLVNTHELKEIVKCV